MEVDAEVDVEVDVEEFVPAAAWQVVPAVEVFVPEVGAEQAQLQPDDPRQQREVELPM